MARINPRKSRTKLYLLPGTAGYVGCSQIASVIGMSKFTTPLEAYRRFHGTALPPTEEQQEIFDRGHRAEAFIAKEIENTYGYRLQCSNYAWLHPTYNWFICHPDRLVVGGINGQRIGVEIKSSSVYTSKEWGDENTDEVPLDYYLQCLGYMACGVCDEVHLFRCSDWKLTRYIIKYDEERIRKMEEMLEKAVSDFLDMKEPAPTTWKECTQVYTDSKDDLVADETMLHLCELYDKAKEDEKAATVKADELKAIIVKKLEGKRRIIGPSGGKPIHTYYSYEQNSIDTKALREQMPEIAEKFIKTKTVYSFR